MSLRGEPRSFLYDDYMDQDLRSHDRGRLSARDVAPDFRRRDMDISLDDYAGMGRSAGISRRGDLDYPSQRLTAGNSRDARRFADAMGIPSSTRARHVYDDLDYGVSARSRAEPRVIYRDAPRQIMSRRVGRDFYDSPREVVQIVERVRRPQRRVQVVRKVPIHQRVVKKVIVKQTVRRGGVSSNRNVGGNNKAGGRVNTRLQRRPNVGGGIQKKKGGPPKKENKPKLSASELDRELDEYMKSSKHPRVEL